MHLVRCAHSPRSPRLRSRIASGPTHRDIELVDLVATEQMRMSVRYAIGEDWSHDGTSTAGQWALEHRFVAAETELFEHPGCP